MSPWARVLCHAPLIRVAADCSRFVYRCRSTRQVVVPVFGFQRDHAKPAELGVERRLALS
ncbi:hypothetical protein K788_0004262 (plasmid) [Paraburkholderia caribensis MBA4]|uniref:Uncharacterized protein n=1 Tax=Paraburkholderia caribensis MBA4 TaxID=1323664 RepID=A0A0P0RPB4_9BURK|nr:hypothetical protein K788_0004262 [Paraburkholderia caribensis MBA4]